MDKEVFRLETWFRIYIGQGESMVFAKEEDARKKVEKMRKSEPSFYRDSWYVPIKIFTKDGKTGFVAGVPVENGVMKPMRFS